MPDQPVTHRELWVAYWNTDGGAVDGDDDQRLEQLLEILNAEDLDAVCLGETRWREPGNPEGNRRLHDVAHRLGMTGRYLVHSSYYECDMAILLNEDKFRVVEERHEHGIPWFHALGRLETFVPGFGRLDLVVNHFAPSMATIREQEADAFKLLGKVPMIALGDYNARAVADLVNPAAFTPDKEHKLDDTPDRIIQKAGFTDVGAAYGEKGDLSPTVGWGNGRQARLDRVYHNIPGARVTGYKVIPPTPRRPLAPRPATLGRPARERRFLSDHGGVIAGIALPITLQ